MTWRYVTGYAVGTSHVRTSTPCQDRCAAQLFTAADGGEILACAVSDGAGSAKLSEFGAKIVCDRLLECVRLALGNCSDLDALTDELIRSWFIVAREEIRLQAGETSANDFGQYAATGLLAIAAPFQTVCAQIGDGGIVIRPDGTAEFEVAIWPEASEYANETFFVTDATAAEHIKIERFGQVTDVIAFSDGLQRLAIEQPTKQAHERFFNPLVSTVRGGNNVHALQLELDAYLSSEAVNQRTDDDKSLAIACRL